MYVQLVWKLEDLIDWEENKEIETCNRVRSRRRSSACSSTKTDIIQRAFYEILVNSCTKSLVEIVDDYLKLCLYKLNDTMNAFNTDEQIFRIEKSYFMNGTNPNSWI